MAICRRESTAKKGFWNAPYLWALQTEALALIRKTAYHMPILENTNPLGMPEMVDSIVHLPSFLLDFA
jgi:hypothetical protein